MPGYRGSNRVPGADPRTRRNWNSNATLFSDRTLGDGLGLSATRLLEIALAATGGLEFVAGEISIKYPADGGVKTSADGLEVDMAGMAALAIPLDTDLILVEDLTAGDAKKKTTLAQLAAALAWTYPADGAIKNTGLEYQVDISGMAGLAAPAEADMMLFEDSGGSDAKEKTTLAQLRDAVIDPPADGAIKNTAEVFEVDVSGMAAQATPAEGDLFLLEDTGGTDAKEKVTLAQLRDAVIDPPADGAIKNTAEVFEVDISGMAANTTPVAVDLLLLEDGGGTDAKEKVTFANFRTETIRLEVEAVAGDTAITTEDVILAAVDALTITLPRNNVVGGGRVCRIKNAAPGTTVTYVQTDPLDTPRKIDGVDEILELSYLEELTLVSLGTTGGWWII